jgi:hypothetical protein
VDAIATSESLAFSSLSSRLVDGLTHPSPGSRNWNGFSIARKKSGEKKGGGGAGFYVDAQSLSGSVERDKCRAASTSNDVQWATAVVASDWVTIGVV